MKFELEQYDILLLKLSNLNLGQKGTDGLG
jgi:hypothetical protein